MSSPDRLHEDRDEVAEIRRSKRRERGRRIKTAEVTEDSSPFEDYAANRLWSFRCAQLSTALAAYFVMFVGDAWLHRDLSNVSSLVCAAPLAKIGRAHV